MGYGGKGRGRGPGVELPWNLIAKSEGIHSGPKRNGITEHMSGPHLIPNVGREAMLGAEVVRRKPKARPKPKAEPPRPVIEERVEKVRKKEKHRQRMPSASRSRSRSRKRQSRSRSASGSRRGSHRSNSEQSASPPPKEEEEERRLAREREEARRREEEERKLQELMEAKRKQQALAAERKKKLGGAFALDEDEIEGDTNQRQRVGMEWNASQRQLSRKKAAELLLPPAEDSRSASSRRSEALVLPPDRLMETGTNVTAADIDGSFHDHKFAHAWKDWDATKKDNAGEVAKQFMRIAALKRRR